jgi:phage repressor protein C with HTH and peptisase S24 domain
MNMLQKNIIYLMESAGHNTNSLAEASGAIQSNIFRIVEGQSIEPRYKTLKPLADYWGVTVDDLRTKDLTGSKTPTNNVVPIKQKRDDVEIRQYKDVSGGMGNGVLLRDQPGEIQSWRVTPEWLQKNVPSNTGIENLAIVTGFGPSMRGMFNPGDPLLVDRGVREVKQDAVFFFRIGDEGFIKILQRVPGVGIRAISKNKEFETWTITPDMDFEVFAKVLKVWQSEDF